MNQLAFSADLMAPAPMARKSDPVTSKLAAESAKQLQADHQLVILTALRNHGAAGKDRIATLTRLQAVQVARRTIELQRQGLIELTGRNVVSTAGRPEREWRAV